MISKLPKWMWFGGAVLALIAGMINSVGFLSFQHQGVTHLTGTTTLLGIACANGDFVQALHLVGVVGAFLAGCIFSGYLIQDSTLKLGRRYGLALFIESILLFMAVPLLDRSMAMGAYLASCACGLQNGMVSTYSGAVLRTTHVSGMFTDLGIFVGQRLHGLQVDMRRIQLSLMLIISFFLGAIFGAIIFAHFHYATLYFPAALTGVSGFGYGLYKHLSKVEP